MKKVLVTSMLTLVGIVIVFVIALGSAEWRFRKEYHRKPLR